jgi:hypothetical protein
MPIKIQILTEAYVWATICESTEQFYEFVVNSLLDKYENREFRVIDGYGNELNYERF